MSAGPRHETRAEQPYVAIPAKVTGRGRAAALVAEVQEWLHRRGVGAAGPPFLRYWVIGGGGREHIIEVGAPVRGHVAVEGDGRVVAGSIPGGSYVTLAHTGDPERIDTAHARLQDWASGQGLTWDNRGEGPTQVWGGRFEFLLSGLAGAAGPCSVEISYLVRPA
ncbi:AraC family transcriptional regulator [Streptomonospora nanhaiensis]|uniref:AraC family transcriptional regulator n=1 Tax=Streptomonospora nanhaiensis TaxID=1323731 RepID=UPI001C99C873|nr:AraC family transcriptional regulator [Streptomonospora nanhaiensis]MBX9390145.1 AraC family transcriptional regulator [Streptomonospora nanhaiensis]